MNISVYKMGARFYDAIWHDFTDKTLERIRRAFDAKKLEGNPTGGEDTTVWLLDLACGTGELESLLVSLYPRIRIVALDNSQQMLSRAKRKLRDSEQVTFLQGDITRSLPFAGASFDYVIFANALHYVAQPGSLLEEIRRVIKPGGQLIIEDFTINGYFFWALFERLIRLVDPQYYRTYSFNELRRFVISAGFSQLAGECFRISRLWRGMLMTAKDPDQSQLRK